MAIDLSSLNEAQGGIARTLDRPLFVEAGAGSGKTFTLTRRIAWALGEGSGSDGGAFIQSLDQALIITFTNAAALEIKERVRSTLRENGMADQALTVDDAWISTIHGMCSRILKRHALDLGLDPEFKVLPETLGETYRALAQEEVMAERSHDERVARAGEVVGQLFPKKTVAGRGAASVVDLAWQLVDVANRSSRGFDSLVDVKAAGAASRIPQLAADYEGFLVEKRDKCGSQKAIEEAEGWAKGLREFCELAPGQRSEDAALEALMGINGGKGPKANSAPKDRAKELQATVVELVREAKLARLSECLWDVVDLAKAFFEHYNVYKRENSYLDNDDLIRLCLTALRDHPDIARRYSDQFRLVMVDEFQDTDPRQVELVGLLSGGGQRLCTVGDAQQSIYRFRGADVRVFEQRGREVDESDHRRLDVNYRSHADILSFVDAVFGGHEGRAGLLHNFMSLAPNPERKDGYHAHELPRVYIEVASAGSAGNRVAALANQVADRLAAYVAAGEDPDDMALLLGRMGHAAEYVDALRERGIKCVVTGGSTFSSLDEVEVVRALVHTLANPHDTQEGLFSLLSSDMFRLDANDFCALGTTWQESVGAYGKRKIDMGVLDFQMAPGVTPSRRLTRAKEVLERAFSRMGSDCLADVVEGVLVDSGWLLRLEHEGAEGRSKAANLIACVRYLRDLTRELGLGVARACREFDLWLEVAKAHPAVLSGGRGDAVRVMTIHASKGLEFPIVAVGECWSEPDIPTGVLSQELPDGSMRVALATSSCLDGSDDMPDEPGPNDGLSDFVRQAQYEGREADAAEKVRLLYVGVTRAREALVLAVPVAAGRTTELAEGTLNVLVGGIEMAPGEHAVDFGGSAPACMRWVDITVEKGEKDFVIADSGQTLAGFDGTLAARDGVIVVEHEVADSPFSLYELPGEPAEVGFWTPREGTYSYSSAHRAQLARQREERPEPDAAVVEPRGEKVDLLAPDVAIPARILDEDDSDARPQVADDDHATNLGSAFHQLAQAMVLVGGEVQDSRVDATARAWHLSARQRSRLDAALALWAGSDIRAEALGHGRLVPEAPFFVHAPSEYGEWLEGAIDLLCTDEGSNDALVIDYKTGDAGLSVAEVRERHAMQATFYADVLRSQGFERVECAFVCVELEDPQAPGQPLVIRY